MPGLEGVSPDAATKNDTVFLSWGCDSAGGGDKKRGSHHSTQMRVSARGHGRGRVHPRTFLQRLPEPAAELGFRDRGIAWGGHTSGLRLVQGPPRNGSRGLGRCPSRDTGTTEPAHWSKVAPAPSLGALREHLPCVWNFLWRFLVPAVLGRNTASCKHVLRHDSRKLGVWGSPRRAGSGTSDLSSGGSRDATPTGAEGEVTVFTTAVC